MDEYIKPLPLGTIVRPWGKIAAVGSLAGHSGINIRERYYWLVDKYGGVSMMPSDVIEKAASRQS